MKKYFLIGLFLLVLPLAVYAADKSTVLSYTVGNDSSYEWSVPASVTVSSEVTTNNMQQKPGHSATITVSASNVTLTSGYQLVVYYPIINNNSGVRYLVNGNSSIAYYINEGEGDAVWHGELATILNSNSLALRVVASTNSASSNLDITVYESDIAAATAIGEHTDTITFTAAVIPNEE